MTLPVTYKPEITPKDGFELQSSDNLQRWVKSTFAYTKVGKDKHGLFDHQRLVRDYMQFESPYRGILLYHALGVGKTRSAIAVSEVLVNHKDVVVMIPASLQKNFVEELYKFGNELFVKQQHWSLKDKSWVPDPKKPSNYNALSQADRNSIDKQINHVIDQRITFIKYNGLRVNKAKELFQERRGFLDNKLVIIDEVHNFISRVVSGSVVSRIVYKKLMDAQNLKLVCLSGTPFINYPIEFAMLINLLAGLVTTFTLRVKKAYAKVHEEIENKLQDNKRILSWEFDGVHNSLIIRLLPNGFLKNRTGKLVRSTSSSAVADDDAYIESLIDKLKIPVCANGIKSKQSAPLPHDEETFLKRFVDLKAEKNVVLEAHTLIKALGGLVSYYAFHNPEHFPIADEMQVVHVPLSDLQFEAYKDARKTEAEDENKEDKFFDKKTKKNMWKKLSFDDLSTKKDFAYFKMLSRMASNFIFPVRKRKDDRKNPDRLMTLARDAHCFSDKLDEHGPKYLAAYNRIQRSKGPVLVYSQYRTHEGVGVMKEVLDARGYSEISIKGRSGKYRVMQSNHAAKKRYIVFSNQDPEKTRILVDIFNGNVKNLPASVVEDMKVIYPSFAENGNTQGDIVKAILITQSGSEGISLKNVRQVHILEPYWNYIRIRQIIGRAIRAHSHNALDKKDRTVQVYMYVALLNAEQKKEMDWDNSGASSDEIVYRVAQKKDRILSEFQMLLKKNALDCMVHKKVHAHEGFDCHGN